MLLYRNEIQFLPETTKLKKENSANDLTELEIEVKLGLNTEISEFQKEMLFLIVQKFYQPNASERWNFEDYKSFRKCFANVVQEDLESMKSSIINCLCATRKEQLEELKTIAKNTNFYPEEDRIYDKEAKTYYRKSKEVSSMDTYRMIVMLPSQMNQIIRTILEKMLEIEPDLSVLRSNLKEIITSGTEEQKDALLTDFDNAFSFLKESKLYSDLYFHYRKRVLPNALNQVDNMIAKKNKIEYRNKEIEYYDFREESRRHNENRRHRSSRY